MDIQNIVNMYYKENCSIADIAAHYNTYGNKIRRLLIKHGHEPRNRSDAQKLALEQGKLPHPTEGKERSIEERMAISGAVANTYDALPDAEKQRRVEVSRLRWQSLPDEDKKELARLAHEGLRKSAKEGSKLEKYIKAQLDNAGFYCTKHAKGLVPNTKLEPDLYIDKLRTIVEVDGLSHFSPIWGEETLQKVQAADAEKNGLFLMSGYCVIRIKNIFNSSTLYRYQQAAELVLAILQDIEEKYPPVGQRYFELEVKV